MAKQQVTMTIDSDVAQEFQSLFPNERSSYCTEMMRLKISTTKGDVNGVKYELLINREKELQEKNSIIVSEIQNIRNQLNIYKEQKALEAQKVLEEEEKRIRSMITCDGCGFQAQQMTVKADGLKFCNSCFMNEHPKMVEALKKEKEKKLVSDE